MRCFSASIFCSRSTNPTTTTSSGQPHSAQSITAHHTSSYKAQGRKGCGHNVEARPGLRVLLINEPDPLGEFILFAVDSPGVFFDLRLSTLLETLEVCQILDLRSRACVSLQPHQSFSARGARVHACAQKAAAAHTGPWSGGHSPGACHKATPPS